MPVRLFVLDATGDVGTHVIDLALSSLERALGARLLRRSTRHLELTKPGDAYYQRVTRGLAVLTEANVAVRGADGAPSGEVRVRVPFDLGAEYLGALASRFGAIHPSITVELHTSNRGLAVPIEGYDLVVQAGRVSGVDLVVRELGASELRLYASPTYLDVRPAPRALADLRRHRLVLVRRKRVRPRLEMFGPHGVESVDVEAAIVADDHAVARSAVCAGAGIGLLPDAICQGAVKRVLTRYRSRGRPLVLLSPPLNQLPERVLLFRAFLIENLALLPDCTAARSRCPREPRYDRMSARVRCR